MSGVMADVMRMTVFVRRSPLLAVFLVVQLYSLIFGVKEGVVPRAFGVRRTALAAVEISCCRLQFSNVWSYCMCCT